MVRLYFETYFEEYGQAKHNKYNRKPLNHYNLDDGHIERNKKVSHPIKSCQAIYDVTCMKCFGPKDRGTPTSCNIFKLVSTM